MNKKVEKFYVVGSNDDPYLPWSYYRCYKPLEEAQNRVEDFGEYDGYKIIKGIEVESKKEDL